MKFGYARISTPQQSMELQIDSLKRAGCEKIFKDVYTTSTSARPGFDDMVSHLRSGDVVTVTTLDRLGRSNRFLLELLDEWNKKEIHIHILSHQIDTTTTQGKFLFSIMAALAEQEKNLINERVRKGVAEAKARGRSGGRKISLTEKEMKKMKQLYEEKVLGVKEICLMYNISKPTIYNYLKRLSNEPNNR